MHPGCGALAAIADVDRRLLDSMTSLLFRRGDALFDEKTAPWNGCARELRARHNRLHLPIRNFQDAISTRHRVPPEPEALPRDAVGTNPTQHGLADPRLR